MKLFIALDVRKWSLEMPKAIELIKYNGLIAVYEVARLASVTRGVSTSSRSKGDLEEP